MRQYLACLSRAYDLYSPKSSSHRRTAPVQNQRKVLDSSKDRKKPSLVMAFLQVATEYQHCVNHTRSKPKNSTEHSKIIFSAQNTSKFCVWDKTSTELQLSSYQRFDAKKTWDGAISWHFPPQFLLAWMQQEAWLTSQPRIARLSPTLQP